MKEQLNASTLSGLAPRTFWEAVHNQWGNLPARIEMKSVRLSVRLIEATGQRAPWNPGLTASEKLNKE